MKAPLNEIFPGHSVEEYIRIHGGSWAASEVLGSYLDDPAARPEVVAIACAMLVVSNAFACAENEVHAREEMLEMFIDTIKKLAEATANIVLVEDNIGEVAGSA